MIVDLCAGGAGGWDHAARQLGIGDPVGIEFDGPSCRTRAAAGLLTVRTDMTVYPPERFAGAEGLIASPPCTSFSKAGKRQGLNDPRGQLVWQPIRWATIMRPRWVACEQVPEVLPIWKLEADKLRTLGYRTWVGILDAADYGTPQNRRRAILIASLDHQPSCPTPTHCKGGRPATASLLGAEPALAPWRSMAEALRWDEAWELEQIRGSGMVQRHGERPTRRASEPSFTVTGGREGDSQGRWRLHTNSFIGHGSERDVDRPAPTVDTKAGTHWCLHTNRAQQPDGTRQLVDPDRPAPSVTTKAGGQWDWALTYPGQSYASPKAERPVTDPAPTVALGHNSAAWCWQRPATTVVGSFGGGSRIAPPGHHTTGTYTESSGAVRVTCSELGVLQDFPVDHPWQGTKTQQATQIGNAIPVRLAAAVLREATRGMSR